MTKESIYQSVTDRIVAAIEEGTAPWRMPWKGGFPTSMSTGKHYRGINSFLLGLMPYSDHRWGTFRAMREAAAKQAQREGREIVTETRVKNGYQTTEYSETVDGEKTWFRGGVRKGEKSTWIVLWKPVKKRHAE